MLCQKDFVKSAFSKARMGRSFEISITKLQKSPELGHPARRLPRLSLINWQNLIPLLSGHPNFRNAKQKAGISRRSEPRLRSITRINIVITGINIFLIPRLIPRINF